MTRFSDLPRPAKAFWFFVVLAGCACFGRAMLTWNLSRDTPLQALIYLIAAIATSGLKIRLPGIFGTLSMNYVVIIVGAQDLSPGTAIMIAAAGALGQCLLHATSRPKWFQVVFSVAGMPVPTAAAAFILRSPLLARADHTGCVQLIGAAMAYFVLNTAAVAGIIACSTGKPLYKTWRDSYVWTSPQYLAGSGIAGLTHFLGHNWGWPALAMALPPVYLVYRTYTIYLGRVDEQQKHLMEMSALHLRTIETLALAIDAKDDTTAAHLHRVQVYAAEIGKELNLPPDQMQALNAAALLHDVGKLAVPEYIISKPGKLTEEEFEKMKVHPVVGAEILECVKFPYPVVPIVRSHHEKYDGTGYPDGLAGEQIPIGARILSAVDCLDALASPRQYRPAFPLETAIKMVVEQSGKSYDPRIVEILHRRYKELELKAREETVDVVKLSSNTKIERGKAPDAGFAEKVEVTPKTHTVQDAGDFSHSIAAARREFQMLIEVTNDLGNSLRLDETLALLAIRVGRIVEHDAIAIYILQDEKLIPQFVRGESFRLFNSLQIPVGQGLSGWVAKNNLPIVNGNPAVEAGYLGDPRLVTQLRSAIAVPLSSGDRVIGVLALYSLAAAAFTPDHKRILMVVAPRAGQAIENSCQFQSATNAAETDGLTGLMNAGSLFRSVQQQVSRSSRNGESFAVLLLDLDGFKSANDRFGHLTGNRLLQGVAEGWKRICRAHDVVARLGGDEFVLVLVDPPHNLDETLERMREVIRTAQVEAGCDGVDFSVGVARYPEDGTGTESLLEKADERMYEDKRRKKSERAASSKAGQAFRMEPAA